MIEMKIMGIALDTRNDSPIVILSDKDNRKAIPIWIGTAEASAIIRQLENISTERPMTHDLISDILAKTGYTITKIEINDVNSSTYYASIFIANENEVHVIDSRPSDAIAIALKEKTPIFVTENVILNGTFSTNQEKDEQESEEFRNFIKDVKPSDFKKLINDNEEFS